VTPEPGDEVVIADGHMIRYIGADDPEDECAKLTIEPGGTLIYDGVDTEMQIGGNGVGTVGGVHVYGDLELTAGSILSIDPDGNAAIAEDGVTIYPGGSISMRGASLYEGVVETVVADDGSPEIVFTASGLPLGLDISRSRVVWRSGLRKGRWYDISSIVEGSIALDANSRANNERKGPPDHTEGNASVSGNVVTGVGTDWDGPLANGSWWWCASDGESAAVRIRRVDGPGALQLAMPYRGSGCQSPGAYAIRDENQPYPATELTEQIAAGDQFRIILPATLRSRYGSDATFDEQTFLRVQDGAAYHFENASFESLGKEAWEGNGGSGILISGFDGETDVGGIFETVEIWRYGGEAGLEWEDSTDFDVDWLFLHWAHPLVGVSNEAHGVKLDHNTPQFMFENVRIRNARFDRTNDDFVWWSTAVGGSSGVYDSIGRYCPNSASGRSCDAIDTSDATFDAGGGQLRIERNLFTNIGADDSASCLYVALATYDPGQTWRGTGWVARDNICLNIQNGSCIRGIGNAVAWDSERIWAVNNVCSSISLNGTENIPYLYQNQILNHGPRRVSGTYGVKNGYQVHGNVVLSAELAAGDLSAGSTVAIGKNLDNEAHWEGTGWEVSDNLLIPSFAGIAVHSWSSQEHPAAGGGVVSHNVIYGNPWSTQGGSILGFADTHEEPQAFHVTVTDGIYENMLTPGSRAGTGSFEAANDTIDSNVINLVNTPPWNGNLTAVNNRFATTGIDALGLQFELTPDSEAWDAVTTDGDKPGPRFAGVLTHRLPYSVPGLIGVIDPEDDDGDADSDALIDRWDNCPYLANPGWGDNEGDGLGDSCDDDDDDDGVLDPSDNCHMTANPDQYDSDSDGPGDACDECPMDPANDIDGDAVCGEVDNCPQVINPDQSDIDSDGLGDSCDACPSSPLNDIDSDGVCGDVDNCPETPNGDQLDSDSDGLGEACDSCPLNPAPDYDTDGYCGAEDNCPNVWNTGQENSDKDTLGDACDNCPLTDNQTQTDTDSDLVGDSCDICPLGYDPGQEDSDSDGCGDLCDPLPVEAWFAPDALNLKSDGLYATILIRLREPYSVGQIDSGAAITLALNGHPPLVEIEREIVDGLMQLRYARQDVFTDADPGTMTPFVLSGMLDYGCGFEAVSSVPVIDDGLLHINEGDQSSILDDAIRGNVLNLGIGFDGDLGDVTCLPDFLSNYTFTVNDDPAIPLPEEVFFYLYEFCVGEDCSFGTTSAGGDRLPSSGSCP
jgi:hypothetical protein